MIYFCCCREDSLWGPGRGKSLVEDIQNYLGYWAKSRGENISAPKNKQLLKVQRSVAAGETLVAVSDSELGCIYVVSVESGDGVYKTNQMYPVLRDKNSLKRIYCMEWADYTSTLFAGTEGGICVWRIHQEG